MEMSSTILSVWLSSDYQVRGRSEVNSNAMASVMLPIFAPEDWTDFNLTVSCDFNNKEVSARIYWQVMTMFYAYKDGKNIAGSVSEEKLVELCNQLQITDYVISQEAPPKRVLTADQEKAKIKATLLKAVDDYMDRTVQARGYDNIAKCVTYEGDIDPIFNREGTAAKQWRSRVYRTCYNILDGIEAGYRPVPTVEELIAELPKIEW